MVPLTVLYSLAFFHFADNDPCGSTVRRAIGDRHYLLRAPAHASCSAGHALPLAVLIHCYGCEATMEISKYSAAADTLGFVLAAPVGFRNSFNAPHCCGPAKDRQLNDVAFVDAIVTDLLSQRHGPLPIAERALFAAGFSNGGFLASKLVDARNGSRHAWAGLAPAAGHEYDVRRDAPMPVMMHHCNSDMHVNPRGCCLVNEQPTCCCGIVAETCVATQSIFAQWLAHNRCSGQRTLPAQRAPPGATCSVGSGCAMETALCLYSDCHHADWARAFVASGHVLAFFARQACERHGGHRRDEAPDVCTCPGGRSGAHCLHEHARSTAPAARGVRARRGRFRALRQDQE